MAGNNPKDVLLVDFCKSPRLNKIAKQYVLGGSLTGQTPTMLNSLGCFPVVSIRDSAAAGVLERINQNTGAFKSELLASADGTLRSQPGPSSHVYAIPTSLGTGSIANPFPLDRADYAATHTFGTDAWFTESGGGFQTLHGSNHHFVGFGAGQQPYWVLKVPPGREFNGVSTGRLENHFYDNYLLMPLVSYHCEPLSLSWSAVNSWYEWGSSGKDTSIVTNQVGGGGTGERYTVDLRWNEVRPCFLSAATFPISAANLGDGNQNGAGLFRSYTYRLLDSNIQVPDFGGSAFHPYSYAQSDFRDTLIVYSDSTNAPSGFTLDFETLSPTIGGAPLPTPQRNMFDSGFGPTFQNNDTCSRYQIPTLTARDLGGGDGTRVYLQFSLTIPGGFSKSGFIELIKDPLATQVAWNVTPRYHEIVLQFIHETGLP
jgi:hypothetical protein